MNFLIRDQIVSFLKTLLLRRVSVSRKANRKSQKLSPFQNIAKILPRLCGPQKCCYYSLSRDSIFNHYFSKSQLLHGFLLCGYRKTSRHTYINLTLSMLGKMFSRRQFGVFFLLLSQKIGFCISCKLSPEETICINFQSLCPGKNKKNVINLSSAEFTREFKG